MDAKKHLVFYATLAGLGLAALTGVVLTGLEYASFSKSSARLATAERSVSALLNKEPVALTEENEKTAKANFAALVAAEAAHREEISGGTPAARFEDPAAATRSPDAGELGSIIKESVERWRAACRDAGVKLAVTKPDEFAFGFSRYFRTGVNPQKSLHEINRQTRIVDFLIKSLIEAGQAKPDGGVRLVAVDREPVELPAGTRNFNKDEIAGVTDKVLRREGLLRSECYRVRFVGRTEVLRHFVNSVTDSGRALAVRGVDIAPVAAELLVNHEEQPVAAPALSAGLFGDAATVVAGAEAVVAEAKPELVVPDAPSDITVTFAFVEPVKPEVAAPAENGAAN